MAGRKPRGWGLVLVRGRSMHPTFTGHRRLALVRWGVPPTVGDVVVAERPDRAGPRIVKRVTGREQQGWWLESDAGTEGSVLSDSWLFGPVPADLVLGVVRWPDVSGARRQ